MMGRLGRGEKEGIGEEGERVVRFGIKGFGKALEFETGSGFGGDCERIAVKFFRLLRGMCL